MNITSVTAVKPAVLTFATPVATVAIGDMVLFGSTNKAKLDGYAYRVSAVGGAGVSVTLADLDGTAMGGALGAVGHVQVFEVGEVVADDLLHACVATVTVAGQAPDSINLDDMCSATTCRLAGNPNLPIHGRVDGAARLLESFRPRSSLRRQTGC